MLPKGWRLGRPRSGTCSLYFNEQWITRFDVSDDNELVAKEIIKAQPPKVVPELFKLGKLKLKNVKTEQGMRNLVKAGLVDGMTAYETMPSIRGWLKSKKLWVEPLENYVRMDGKVYKQKYNRWYAEDPSGPIWLPKKKHFESVWEARISYAQGYSTLADVAEYSFGAVLECCHDACFALSRTIYLDRSTRANTKFQTIWEKTCKLIVPRLRFELQKILKTPRHLCGFRKHKLTGNWMPVFNREALELNPMKRDKFWELFEEMFKSGKLGGHEAHLIFTNAYPDTIAREKERWMTKLEPYIPYFQNYRAKIDRHKTLADAANYVIKNALGAWTLGWDGITKRGKARNIVMHENSIIFFKYKHFDYGIRVASGKLFMVGYEDDERDIRIKTKRVFRIPRVPVGFSKWSTESAIRYLTKEYQDEIFIDRYKKWKQQVGYLMGVHGYSRLEAEAIADADWDWYSHEFQKKIRRSARWACLTYNKTAQPLLLLHHKVWKAVV